MAPARAAGTPLPILFYFLSLLYPLSGTPPVPAASLCKMLPRRIWGQASGLSELHTPRQGKGLLNMIFPLPFERPAGPPCFKRVGRRSAGLAPSARIRQNLAAKGSRHISEWPLCFSGCAFVPPPGFSGPSGFGTSRSPAAGFQHTKWAPGRRPFCFLGFSEMSPAVPWRVKGLSPSVPGEARWAIQYQKDAARSGEPRLREAGKVMQGRENSAPPERLAGRMPFQSLRKPQALPGGRLRARARRAK